MSTNTLGRRVEILSLIELHGADMLRARLLERTITIPETGCIRTLRQPARSHPQISVRLPDGSSRLVVAARLAVALDRPDSWRDHLDVRHRCVEHGADPHDPDLARCINPAHLVIGTNRENVRDRHLDGTRRAPNLDARSLPDKLVLEIVERSRAGVPPSVLADEYGVDSGDISAILRGRTYADVTGISWMPTGEAARRRTAGRDEVLRILWLAGFPVNAIAAMLSSEKLTVSRRALDYRIRDLEAGAPIGALLVPSLASIFDADILIAAAREAERDLGLEDPQARHLDPRSAS